jgi:hypothetical protein
MDTEETIVVFRQWPNGDVIALFPELPADISGIYCTSYERIGQHGAADYTGVISRTTKPTNADALTALMRELTQIGYRLSPRARYTKRR